MLEDKLLIWKIKNGDKEGLRLIYEKYKDDLLTIATAMMNDYADAEDVLHDVFISFARNAAGFHLYGSLRNYLITCVINRVRDRYRRKMYQVTELDNAAPVSSAIRGPQSQAADNEANEILIDALGKIPLQQRETIVLHLQGGLKFREIADLQEASTNTVRARYHYGLEKLRGILNRTITE